MDKHRRFELLVEPQMGLVLRTAQILAGNAAEAEDLAQETLVRAFNAIERFIDGTDIRSWLLTILRHVRIDAFRSGRRSAGNVSFEQTGIDPADDAAQTAWSPQQPPAEILAAFSDQEVIDALNRLPEEIRWTLLLVDVEGLDHAQAAAILAVPIGTIKSRTHRGRSMLRQALLPLAQDRRMSP